jgi:uncharacterized protein (DUF4213/DUF364 family)
VDGNAEHFIATHGQDRRVALVGHFPFVDDLRSQVRQLWVLEQNPHPGDLPADQAAQVLPHTGMTLVNDTLDDLLALCSREAKVILVGPSAPLSPVLFDFGIHLVAGAVVVHIDAVLQAVMQAGNFRQIHQSGVRLVGIQKNN